LNASELSAGTRKMQLDAPNWMRPIGSGWTAGNSFASFCLSFMSSIFEWAASCGPVVAMEMAFGFHGTEGLTLLTLPCQW